MFDFGCSRGAHTRDQGLFPNLVGTREHIRKPVGQRRDQRAQLLHCHNEMKNTNALRYTLTLVALFVQYTPETKNIATLISYHILCLASGNIL